MELDQKERLFATLRPLVLFLLLAGSALAGTRVSVGVHIGSGYGYDYYPPPPPPVVVYQAPCPGPGYVWVPAYYDAGPRVWRRGYWAPPRHGFRRHDRGPRHYKHDRYRKSYRHRH